MISNDTKDQYITLESYEKEAQSFTDRASLINSSEWDLGKWIQFFLSQMDQDGEILELGTGMWRDADYIESLGYHIIRSDAVDSFIEMNKQRWKDIIKLDLLDFDFTRIVQWVFANKVLLHFTKPQFREIVQHIADILSVWGIFALSLKKWEWSEMIKNKMDEMRFFQYRHEDDLKEEFMKLWFSCIYETVSEGERGSVFIRMLVKKIK